MLPIFLRILPLILGLVPPTAALNIAYNPSIIESIAQLVATQDFFQSPTNTSATLVDGNVGSLVQNTTIDLAGNVETQALRTFHRNPNLRIIYTICEEPYSLIVPKRLNITSLAQLKGKKVGSYFSRDGNYISSAQYFVHKFLASAGLRETDYTLVEGINCRGFPCGNTSLPAMIARGEIDAVGMWEPTVEYAIQVLGGRENVVVFQDGNVYREFFNLHSTAERLADGKVRREIVAFVRAIRKAQAVFEREPERFYERASKAVGVEVDIVKAVWGKFSWKGGLPGDLMDVLVEQEEWVAREEKREAVGREKLATLIDRSVLREVEEAEALEI